jgi:hypothetical protein
MSIVFNDGKELTDRQRALFFKLVNYLKKRVENKKDENIITFTPQEFKEFTGLEYNKDTASMVYKTLNFPVEECDFSLEKWYIYWPIGGVRINQSEFSFEVSKKFINDVKHKDWEKLLLNNSVKAGITSKCGLALYDLIVSEVFLPWTVSLEDFKKAMGINLGQYPRPNSLRERCIDVGIEEINTNAGYKLSYKQNKDGKNITGLTFFLLDEKE